MEQLLLMLGRCMLLSNLYLLGCLIGSRENGAAIKLLLGAFLTASTYVLLWGLS
jgi:hypothetical protein